MKIALLVVAVLVLVARPAAAEWFADAYAGATFGQTDNVKANDRSSGIATYHDVDFDTGMAYGLRFGKYFETVPFLGFAVDGYSFSSNIGPQTVRADGCLPSGACGTNKIGFGSYDLSAVALSLDLFLRLPLMASADAPGGRLQPYVLGGAPMFITSLTPRNTRLFRNADGDTDVSLGYKGGAGVAFYVYKNLMVFGEYRFTHTEPEYEIRGASAARATFRTDLDTHAGLAGLSARW
jgi:opacity protein-like surface antigen